MGSVSPFLGNFRNFVQNSPNMRYCWWWNFRDIDPNALYRYDVWNEVFAQVIGYLLTRSTRNEHASSIPWGPIWTDRKKIWIFDFVPSVYQITWVLRLKFFCQNLRSPPKFIMSTLTDSQLIFYQWTENGGSVCTGTLSFDCLYTSSQGENAF